MNNNSDIVTVKGQPYRLDKMLGTGITAVVYKAWPLNEAGIPLQQAEAVAIKEARSELGTPENQEKLDAFNLEWDVLMEFRAVYEDPTKGYSWHIPRPLNFERSRFIVQSLALGESLPELLSRRLFEDNAAFLAEEESLEIARQLTEVLHVLHHELRRSYTDFQIKNIYWNKPDANTPGQIMVVDWNHVSDKGQGQPTADIAQLGRFLYRMATGQELQGTRIEWHPFEAGISFGFRQIITKAVNADRQIGDYYTNTGPVRADLDQLQTLYRLPLDKLGAQVFERLKAEDFASPLARLEFDLYRRRQPNPDDTYLKFMNERLSERDVAEGIGDLADLSLLERSKGLLAAGEYSLAVAAKLRAFAQENPSLAAWRLVYAVEVAAQPGSYKSDEEKQVNTLLLDLLNAVTESSGQEQPLLLPSSFQRLNDDFTLRKELAEVYRIVRANLPRSRQDYINLAEKYRSILARLETFPDGYRQALRQELENEIDGNLETWHNEFMQVVDSLEKLETTKTKDFNDLRAELSRQLSLSLVHPAVLNFCGDLVSGYLEKGELQVVLELTELGLRATTPRVTEANSAGLSVPRAKLQQQGQLAWQLYKFEQYLGNYDYVRAYDWASQVLNNAAEKEKTRHYLYQLQLRAFDHTVQIEDVPELETLIQNIENLRKLLVTEEDKGGLDKFNEASRKFRQKITDKFKYIIDKPIPNLIIFCEQELSLIQANLFLVERALDELTGSTSKEKQEQRKRFERASEQAKNKREKIEEILKTYQSLLAAEAKQNRSDVISALTRLSKAGILGYQKPGDLEVKKKRLSWIYRWIFILAW